jgi:hypothetical protein
MLTLLFSILVSAAQLTNAGSLPQILTPAFKSSAPLHSGKRGEVIVSFTGLKDYRIDRLLSITLKLTPVLGVTLPKTEIKSSSEDPKSKDGYYVELPTLRIPLTPSKAGKFEIPGKLTYFFCSEKDGFCSRQILDVKVPVTAQ